MTDPKNTPKNKPVKDSKSYPEDLEKTLFDLKVDETPPLEETLIFKSPPKDEEGTALHDLNPLLEKEKSETPQEQKDLRPLLLQSEQEDITTVKPFTKPTIAKKVTAERMIAEDEKTSLLQEESLQRESVPSFPGKSFSNIIFQASQFLLNSLLLLILFDAAIEGLAVASPLSKVTLVVTFFCLAISIFFLLRKFNLGLSAHLSTCGLLALMSAAAFRYGSADSTAFSLFRHSLGDIYNFVFLLIASVSLVLLLFVPRRGALVLKIVLAVLLIYGSAGFIENIIRGYRWGHLWKLEDTLLGTDLWKWIPWAFLRPTMAFFWIVLPLLLFYFTFYGILRKGGGRSRSFISLTLFMTFLLGQILLSQHRMPSLLGPFKKNIGIGRIKVYPSRIGNQDFSFILATSSAKSNFTDDFAELYQMASLLDSSPDQKKKISLMVRTKEGQSVPYLQLKDFVASPSLSPSGLKNLKFSPHQMMEPKALAILFDRSSSPLLSTAVLSEAVRNLYPLLNSKEKIYERGMSENLNPAPPHLEADFNEILKTFGSRQGTHAIFLMTSSEASFSESAQNKISSALKSLKIPLYILWLGDSSTAPRWKALADISGGKIIEVVKPEDFPQALVAAFADFAGEYRVEVEAGALPVQVKIVAPEADSWTHQSALRAKVYSSADIKLSKARLYVDQQFSREIPINQPSEISFSLGIKPISPGSHSFKVEVLDDEGRVFSDTASLTLKSSQDFKFIRPLEGDTINGSLDLEVSSLSGGPSPPIRVDFLMDGNKIGEVGSDPYLITWNAQGLSGIHTLQARGTFADGMTQSDQIKIDIAPGPSVKILSPSAGEYVPILTEIQADALSSTSEKISKVEFWADQKLLTTLYEAPFRYLWDSSDLAPGKHLIQVRAYTDSSRTNTNSVIIHAGTGTLMVSLPPSPSAFRQPQTSTGEAKSYFSPDYIEWVLDASATMSASWERDSKLNVVKKEFLNVFTKVPPSTQVAFRLFGSQAPATHHLCTDSLLASSFKPAEQSQALKLLSTVKAGGLTPLGYTLRQIQSDLKGLKGSKTVVLVTDGYENCGLDPISIIKNWKNEKLNIRLHIFGLGIGGSLAERELKNLASLAGGQYFSINQEEELKTALEQTVTINYRVLDYKGREVLRKPVGLGDTLRSGEYQLEVELEPLLTKNKVNIMNGLETKILIKKEAENYLWGEPQK